MLRVTKIVFVGALHGVVSELHEGRPVERRGNAGPYSHARLHVKNRWAATLCFVVAVAKALAVGTIVVRR